MGKSQWFQEHGGLELLQSRLRSQPLWHGGVGCPIQ